MVREIGRDFRQTLQSLVRAFRSIAVADPDRHGSVAFKCTWIECMQVRFPDFGKPHTPFDRRLDFLEVLHLFRGR